MVGTAGEEPDTKRVRFDPSSRKASGGRNGDANETDTATSAASAAPKLRAYDVVELRFVREASQIDEQGANGGHDPKLSARPTYLHQIFPNDDIFGWQQLNVVIYVSSISLTTWVDVAGIKADAPEQDDSAKFTNVKATLFPFIKAGRVESRAQFVSALQEDFVPPVANCVRSYQIGDETYGVFKEKLSKSAALKDFHKRMSFFMFVHIDGASFIDDQDPRWELFTIHQLRDGRPTHFVGYATTYPFASLRQSTDLNQGFSERIRISQVLILPCFQGGGHGGRLLTAIYDDASQRNAMEVTVEDPSEGFRLLRDLTDLRRAYLQRTLQYDKALVYGQERELVEQLREKLKLTRGQARRCLEVHQLKHVDTNNEEEYKRYRLWVKRRLHHDYLEVIDYYGPKEKKAKLAEIYSDYESEYKRVVDRLEKRGEFPPDTHRPRPTMTST